MTPAVATEEHRELALHFLAHMENTAVAIRKRIARISSPGEHFGPDPTSGLPRLTLVRMNICLKSKPDIVHAF